MAKKPAAPSEGASPESVNKPRAAPGRITINPTANDLTLNQSDTLDESISVIIPKGNKCKNVDLVPSVSIAAFIALIAPPGYGPITGEQDQTLTFRVRLISCATDR